MRGAPPTLTAGDPPWVTAGGPGLLPRVRPTEHWGGGGGSGKSLESYAVGFQNRVGTSVILKQRKRWLNTSKTGASVLERLRKCPRREVPWGSSESQGPRDNCSQPDGLRPGPRDGLCFSSASYELTQHIRPLPSPVMGTVYQFVWETLLALYCDTR